MNDGIELKELLGIEINHNSQVISKMVLGILVNDSKITKYTIKYANIFTDNLDFDYNKGFIFPPIGLKILSANTTFNTIFNDILLTPRNSSELIFIDKLLRNLKGNKRAVAIVPSRVLFNVVDKEYRNRLIEKDLLEAIIDLPIGFITGLYAKINMLVFSENNKVVKILDASNYFTGKSRNEVILDTDSIIKLYQSGDIKTKTTEELKGLQNWTPSVVLLDIVDPKDGVKLSKIAEVFTGSQYTIRNFEDRISQVETPYKLLTSSDIQDGIIDVGKLVHFNNDDVKLDKFAICKHDMIVTSKSSKVKIAVIDFEPNNKIIVSGGMIVVRPNIKKLNPTYLKVYLESDQGQRLLQSIQKGNVIVTLNSKDLAEVKIPLKPLSIQNKIANKFNSKLSSLWALKSEIEKLENDMKNIYYEIEE